MLSYSTALKDVFYNNNTVKTDVGCTIEYNMNSMIDGITVTTSISDSTYINQVTGIELKYNPYKKMFPIDSIVKPFRPLFSGVKYFVLLPADYNNNSFSAFRTIKYPGEGAAANEVNAKPRVYYPGSSTEYKYWLTPAGQAVNATVTYKQDNTTWAAAGQTGSIPDGNKYAMANKLVIRFEKNHQKPATYSFTITPKTGSATTYGPFTTPDDCSVEHYYNGTNWNAVTAPSSYSSPIEIKSITLTSSAPDSGRVIGVIEVSARWIKDISTDLVSFNISKESSANSEDILPVGFITGNSMSGNILRYNEDAPLTLEYNRTITEFDNTKTYMVKNAEIKPHIKVYHSNATDVVGSYDIVKQGTYYLDSWSVDDYAEAGFTALDNSKYLMETFAPEIVCDNYPVTAIIRQLLDSVGCTNYNFNLLNDPDDASLSIDTSVPTIRYWWTEDTKTVWECLQELCRDIQMNALFDDDNVLQFYSRDYIYNQYESDGTTKKAADWEFYYDPSGSKLANIVSFNKKEIAAGNWVKVLWQSPISSTYVGTSTTLWQSPTSFLAGGGLKYEIPAAFTVSDLNNLSNTGFQIDLQTVDNYSQYQSVFNFNGYMMVQSEIFEYDAIQYQYVAIDDNTNTYIPVWIESESDISKYRYMAKTGYQDPTKPETAFFKPTGRIRIKNRGALGTEPIRHSVPGLNALSDWSKRTVTWQV